MGTHSLWRKHAAALGFYALFSWAVQDHGLSLTRNALGTGSDPWLMSWFLAWWPWALSHHVSPWFTTLVWQPQGLNLAWTTSAPLLALLGLPFTLASGPVLAFNVLTLAAPALAAAAAYALCFQLTRRPLGAFAGGYVFGFSPWEMAHATQHLNLDFTVFIPLLALVVFWRCAGRLGGLGFVGAVALLGIGQFLVSTEMFATTALMAALAWAVAFWRVAAWRPMLRRLVPEAAAAGALAALGLAPVLHAMFAMPRDLHLPPHWPAMFSTDPLNLVVPTLTTLPGGALLLPLSRHFTGFTAEQGAYLGLPLLVVLWLYFRRGVDAARFLAPLFGAIVLLSCGPQLWLGGIRTNIPLPWALFTHLPLIASALPGRLMVFAALAAAVTAALFLAQAPRAGRLAVLICLPLLPMPHAGMPVPYSSFFAPGNVARVLGPGAKLLILPFGAAGPSSFWQAESGFSFAQTGGYLGYPPGAVQRDMPLMRLFFGLGSPDLAADLAAYCHRTGTQYIAAGPGADPAILAAIATLGWPRRVSGDVTLFTVPGP